MKCPGCNQELGIGKDGEYHHFWNIWDGKCLAHKTLEKEFSEEEIQRDGSIPPYLGDFDSIPTDGRCDYYVRM